MSKRSIAELASMGGSPVFSDALHVGQLHLPEWDDFERAFEQIFERRYFTNHGPLVREFDRKFAEHVGTKHAISVTNGTIALMVACKALKLRGEVIVPALTFPATAQALVWAGLVPVFCDVDPTTHNLTADLVEPLITQDTTAILGVHLWGRACDPDGLQELSRTHGLKLFYDACHGIGCTYKGRMVGQFGALAVFSFHATKALSAAEGGCLVTDDDDLADLIRTARNFHVSESFADVAVRINGKMTECQAAMALLSLERFPAIAEQNRLLYERYRERFGSIGGLSFVDHALGEESNYQYCVVEVESDELGFSRDKLVQVLRAENIMARRYFRPGLHRLEAIRKCYPQYVHQLPNTDRLTSRLVQLPLGASVNCRQVDQVCDLIEFCVQNAEAIDRNVAVDAAGD